MSSHHIITASVLLVVCSGLISAIVGLLAKKSNNKSVFLGSKIRKIGTVFATLLSVLFLQEKQGWRRIAISCIIAFGIIIVGIGG